MYYEFFEQVQLYETITKNQQLVISLTSKKIPLKKHISCVFNFWLSSLRYERFMRESEQVRMKGKARNRVVDCYENLFALHEIRKKQRYDRCENSEKATLFLPIRISITWPSSYTLPFAISPVRTHIPVHHISFRFLFPFSALFSLHPTRIAS